MPTHRALAPLLALFLAACGGGGGGGGQGSGLSDFRVERIRLGGTAFESWIAETPEQHAQGLMDATASDLLPLPDGTPRGMLFVFEAPELASIWMLGTEVALDLAYLRADGTVVEVHDLVPYDTTPVTASEPVLYAFEAAAGTFDAYLIGPGSVLDTPVP
jgi:hypothetical protein